MNKREGNQFKLKIYVLHNEELSDNFKNVKNHPVESHRVLWYLF